MRYKTIYMPGPSVEGEWYNSSDEAWDAIMAKTCGFGTGELCEMCQAEWSVFSEKEIEEIEADDEVS